MSDSSDAESGISGIETFYTLQVTLTLAGQDADILLNYCNIEDITGKSSTQLKAPVLILNIILTEKSPFGKCLVS